MTIIFLDVDGVLHPLERRVPWMHCEALEAVVSEFDHARIVISSAWRIDYSLKQLKSFFLTPGFSGRVIGCTPDLSSEPGAPFQVRSLEIQQWLADAGEEYTPHFAIDDQPDLFSDAFRLRSLIEIDGNVGLTPSDLDRIRERLARGR